ncbi:MAG: hypothetical protein ABIO81_03895 [Ginsengibacter sp.]
MKSKHLFAIRISLFLCAILLLSSCAKKIVLNNTGIAPAAQAYAKIKQGKDKNYEIEVKATHLAPSMKLNPPKSTYVIWMVTDINGTKNIGQFQSGTSLLSKTLKGSIKTITSFKPISFFITAEDEAGINYPGNMIILKSY